MTIEWAIVIMILFCILSVISFIMGTVALVFVLALKNSTHRIEWRPLASVDEEEEGFMSVDDLNKKFKKQQEEVEQDQL